MQGPGGISQTNDKTYRKVLPCKTGTPRRIKMWEAIENICSSLTAKEIPPEITTPMKAVILIAITKTDDRFRPIGIGEIIIRVVTKTMTKVVKEDAKMARGSIQCSGLSCASEAVKKATVTAYQNGKTILTWDAQSELNGLSLN